MNKRAGFTIVELLIVIVVIGVLAAISIVAYNGIQQRALNTQITSAAKTYKQAFDAYTAQNGQLPPSNNSNFCLGHSVATCVNTAAQPNWTRDTTTLEPALQTIVSTLPAPSYPTATYGSTDPNMGYIPYRGGTNDPRLDGVNSAFLIYALAGATECPIGPVAGGSWPTYTTANANKYTWRNSSLTMCWVSLSSS